MKRKNKALFFSLFGVAGISVVAANAIISTAHQSQDMISKKETNIVDVNENSLQEKNDSVIKQGYPSEALYTQSETNH